MDLIRKHWRRILLSTTLLILLSASGLVIWAGSEIASPSRRLLMDYHREFLADPAAHGLVIDRFTGSDGTPSLVCTPDPSGRLGERGALIREQLAAGGYKLARSQGSERRLPAHRRAALRLRLPLRDRGHARPRRPSCGNRHLRNP
jgi:hypothetical protein